MNCFDFQVKRNKKRKTNWGKAPQVVIDRATLAVTGGQNVRGAAKDFAIDRMILKR